MGKRNSALWRKMGLSVPWWYTPRDSISVVVYFGKLQKKSSPKRFELGKHFWFEGSMKGAVANRVRSKCDTNVEWSLEITKQRGLLTRASLQIEKGGTIGETKYPLYNSPFLSFDRIERSTNGWPPPPYAWEREIDSGVFVRCLPWKWKVRFS